MTVILYSFLSINEIQCLTLENIYHYYILKKRLIFILNKHQTYYDFYNLIDDKTTE
jgi:hypothetical protein